MFDLVVIGAGLSGLQAAYKTQQAGISTVVVGARDRVGGKIWSVPLAFGRGCVELGGAWINDTLQPRVWSYAQRFGLKVVRQWLEGKAAMQDSDGSRREFPFCIVPDVSYPVLNCCDHAVTSAYVCISSSLKKRKTWNTSMITSKPRL